jgi:hypothetical protein
LSKARVLHRYVAVSVADFLLRSELDSSLADDARHDGPQRTPEQAGRARRRLLCVGTIWVGLIVYGSLRVMTHELTPARAAGSPSVSATSNSPVSESAATATLIMFVHPLCPCSQASVAELGRLLRSADGRLVAKIYFVVPDGLEIDPRESDLWKAAVTLPNTTLLIDRDGAAAKFGAIASGQTFVFNADHTLRFTGGLTAARGKTGQTNGTRALLNLLEGGANQPLIESPVFGCSLQ